MRIGMYPFASSASVDGNLQTMETAAVSARAENVSLLVFHECALCGYPPIESSIQAICPAEIEAALVKVSGLARKHGLGIAVGTVRYQAGKRFNSIIVYDRLGQTIAVYDKQALWGWDTDHFTRGKNSGILKFDGLKLGFRICYDIRFPTLFRELYAKQVNLCIVCFSDTAEQPDTNRYEIIKSHLRSRAAENTMVVMSVNSTSRCQTAPTAVFAPDGSVILEAPVNQEGLVVFDYALPEVTFSMQGIRSNIQHFQTESGKR